MRCFDYAALRYQWRILKFVLIEWIFPAGNGYSTWQYDRTFVFWYTLDLIKYDEVRPLRGRSIRHCARPQVLLRSTNGYLWLDGFTVLAQFPFITCQMSPYLSQVIGLFSFHAFTPSRSCNLLYLNEMLWRIHSSRMLHSVSCTYSLWKAVVVRIHLQNVRFRPFLYDFGRSALDGCSVKLHVKDVSFTLFCSGTACCKAVKAWRLRWKDAFRRRKEGLWHAQLPP